MILNGKLQKRNGTLPSNDVLDDGQLTPTTLTGMMSYMLKALAENPTTHVKLHVEDCVENWLNNHHRARLTELQYESRYHRGYIGRLKRKLSSDPRLSDISVAYDENTQHLRDLREAGSSTAALVACFYRIWAEIDDHALTSYESGTHF